VCPEEGNQDGGRSQGQDLGGAAEVTWFCSAWRRLRGDLITVYNFLKEGSRAGDADLLSLVSSDRT